MSETSNLSRRDFIKNTTLLGGGLLLSFSLPSFGRNSRPVLATAFTPNAFLSIQQDGTVKITTGYAEMGQGIYTAISQLIGEELEMDWDKIKVEAAPISEAYNHLVYRCQMTGGSSSISSDYDRMRQVGATARYMLVAAAAKEWGVDMSVCSTEKVSLSIKRPVQKYPMSLLLIKLRLFHHPRTFH